MSAAWKRGRSRIGVDLAGRAIRAVQMSGDPRQPRMRAAAIIPPRDDAGPLDVRGVARLAEVLDRQGFDIGEIVVAVPRDRLLIATLELRTTATAADIEIAARREIAGMVATALDAMEIGWWSLPALARAGETMHVIVAACLHADAEALLDLFERGGLDVAAIDLESAALLRACAATGGDGASLRCVLAVDWSSMHLVIMLRDSIVYQRTIRGAGLNVVYEALSGQFGIDEAGIESLLSADAGAADGAAIALPASWTEGVLRLVRPIARELESSVRYVQYRYPAVALGEVIVTGEGASIPLLVHHLGRQTEASVRAFAPAAAWRDDRAAADVRWGDLAAAVGLALRET